MSEIDRILSDPYTSGRVRAELLSTPPEPTSYSPARFEVYTMPKRAPKNVLTPMFWQMDKLAIKYLVRGCRWRTIPPAEKTRKKNTEVSGSAIYFFPWGAYLAEAQTLRTIAEMQRVFGSLVVAWNLYEMCCEWILPIVQDSEYMPSNDYPIFTPCPEGTFRFIRMLLDHDVTALETGDLGDNLSLTYSAESSEEMDKTLIYLKDRSGARYLRDAIYSALVERGYLPSNILTTELS